MLLRQDGGGAQHHDLAVVLAALEGGTQGDLGLAEAHVAAEQPVHGLRRLHVGLDVCDGACLVGRHIVGEACLHVLLGGPVGREGVTLHRGASRVEVDQVEGELLRAPAGLSRGARPVGGVEAGEARARAVGAHIARQAVDLLEGNIELVLARVLEQEVVALAAAHLLAHDLAEQGYAMRGVDHVVPGLEGKAHAGGVHAARPAAALRHPRRQVRHREHGQARRGHHDTRGHGGVEEGDHVPGQGGGPLACVWRRHGGGVLGSSGKRLHQGDRIVRERELERLASRAVRHGEDH